MTVTSYNESIFTITDVTIYHNGVFYENNTVVTMDGIGEGALALLCFTNKIHCCNHTVRDNRLGEWYFPDGSTMRISKESNIYRDRDLSVVSLNRRNNAALPSGVYKCNIPDKNERFTDLFIGIYSVDMGTFIKLSM